MFRPSSKETALIALLFNAEDLLSDRRKNSPALPLAEGQVIGKVLQLEKLPSPKARILRYLINK